jgi:hypothetical protein
LAALVPRTGVTTDGENTRTPPRRGAASNKNVAIGNSNARNIAEPGAATQPAGMPSFWAKAGGIVTCTIIRRSDRAVWLAALAARDTRAIEHEHDRGLDLARGRASADLPQLPGDFFTTLVANRLGDAHAGLGWP